MNRWLMAAVIGLTVVGCAEGVEDPQPAPPPIPARKAPPAQTFSGAIEEGSDSTDIPELPPIPWQKPEVPGGGDGVDVPAPASDN